MTGLEHYCEAERLLRMAKSRVFDLSSADLDAAGELRTSSEQLAAADVRATLALAAATAVAAQQARPEYINRHVDAWIAVAGEQS